MPDGGTAPIEQERHDTVVPSGPGKTEMKFASCSGKLWKEKEV